jgi:hypothetical protein
VASNSRRAAGTQTFTDVLKVWFGNKRPNPAQDVADFAAGMTLKVSCFARSAGALTARYRLGELHLTRGAPLTWHPRGDAVTLRHPVTLTDSGKARDTRFAAFQLVSASESYDVELPLADVPLVKYALAAQAT